MNTDKCLTSPEVSVRFAKYELAGARLARVPKSHVKSEQRCCGATNMQIPNNYRNELSSYFNCKINSTS